MHAKPDLRVVLKWMIARSGSVLTNVRRRGLHLNVLTPFDDPSLVRFLRSMPHRARRDICTRALGGKRAAVLFALVLMPTVMLLGIAGQWCGSYFGAEAAGFLLGAFAGGGAVAVGLAIYRNRRLRGLLMVESDDGLLFICPACRNQQTPDVGLVCECGCIVRPFQSIEE